MMRYDAVGVPRRRPEIAPGTSPSPLVQELVAGRIQFGGDQLSTALPHRFCHVQPAMRLLIEPGSKLRRRDFPGAEALTPRRRELESMRRLQQGGPGALSALAAHHRGAPLPRDGEARSP
jgi:hypothetical protein